jgi:TolB-like protein/DNA-binding CsgD family transcriptional regulator
LTGRQLEVLALVMRGQSNKAICRELGLAEPTVKNHVSAILKALNVTSRTEAVIRVGASGWQLPSVVGSAKSVGDGTLPRTFALPDNPSITVLPFTNLSGDPAHNYFADGMVEDITMALGRLPWLFVIASASAFTYKGRSVDTRTVGAELGVRYVLRGSVRKDGGRIRIAVQLADAAHGGQIWTERFDGQLAEVFSMQDRVATQVSAMIAPTLRSKEVERARRKPTDNLTAYDLFLRALPPHRDSLHQNQESLMLLYKALELDPSFAAAYGLAAWCYHVQTLFWIPLSKSLIDEALRLAALAIEFGETDPDALWMAGRTIAGLSDRKDEGMAMIKQSLLLNPNSARAWWASGIAYAYRGQHETAIEHLERSRRLNPLDMAGHAHYTGMSLAHFFAGAFKEARDAAGEALRVWPQSTQGLRMRAATCALLGHVDESRGCVKRLLVLYPEATLATIGGQVALQVGSSAYLEDFLRGLRIAGLPEG